MASQVWVISSGKGGAGKTFITSSFGITIAKLGKKVLLIDLDASGGNLNTSLGYPHSNTNLSAFWSGEKKLKETILETQIPRLSYIQGHWNQWVPLNMDLKKGRDLMTQARELNYDFVIIDVGTGAAEFHLDLFNQADQKYLILNPEPSSIEKTYRFLESLISWNLKQSSTPELYARMVNALTQYRAQYQVGSLSFRDYLCNSIGFQFKSFEQLDQSPVRLVVNQTRSQQDRDLGYSMQSVCRKFYDLPLRYVGWVDYDNAVWQSSRGRTQVLIDKPFTPLAGQFLSMCKEVTQSNFVPQPFRAVV